MSSSYPPTPSKNPWKAELHELIQGASGGFLFGIPLIYTMEVWWIGSYTNPFLMLCILGATFVIVFLLNQLEGFRDKSRQTLGESLRDTIQTLAIGILSATLMLILLQRITLTNSLEEALGKIVFETVPFALGMSFSQSMLQGDRLSSPRDSAQNASQNPQTSRSSQSRKLILQETLTDIGGTAIGALIIAFNIAPTDEVSVLAASASPPWLIAYIFASLLISFCIVFVAGFTNQSKRRQQQGLFQTPWEETILAYFVSLIASALMLWFFHRLNFRDPWNVWLNHSLILGLPAAIGGAAGRLAI